ncbi:hypothetical protein D0C16_21970 [Cellvibrio sp. KY-GH-1]|uniref:hypothetical protein n=1 Tax=Cellvibrio sp. KY-GH-1 TaxID=2303332 RepID=UPI001245063A|nr:hypothetical protein [Cellvibrio sp. KY-GH-1]QEY18416.1 hypothetical protein D0C16_21970 [Cellvibrio sp. KY-GH-1]
MSISNFCVSVLRSLAPNYQRHFSPQKIILYITVLLLTPFSTFSNADSLVNGGVVSSAIILPQQQHSYTFAANANERININVTDVDNTNFIPWVTIYKPDGTYLAQSWSQNVAVVDSIVATQTGTYTVIVRDASTGNASIGAYKIYFSKAPNAVELGSLINGGIQAEFIDKGDIDTYQISANANERININVTDVDNTNFIPWVTIYKPDGTYLTQSWSQYVAVVDSVVATQTGTYTVIVRDASTGNASTGNYNLYYSKAPNAFELGDLINGGIRAEFIDKGDIDTYQISANANERININVTDVDNTNLIPWVTIYKPDGTYLTQSWSQNVAVVDSVVATQTGTYTVIVRDASTGNASTGNYNLYYSKAPNAFELGDLINGGIRAEFIDKGDIDTYQISANANERININVTDVDNTNLIPWVTIYKPDGTYLTQSWSQNVAVVDSVVATQTGTYTVIVRDASTGNASTGNYHLYYAKAPQAIELGELFNGGALLGFIDKGDIDTFHFSVSLSEKISITITDLDNNSFIPRITLYYPDGTYFTQSWNQNTATLLNLSPTQAGKITVLIRDASTGNASTGNYRVVLSKTLNTN